MKISQHHFRWTFVLILSLICACTLKTRAQESASSDEPPQSSSPSQQSSTSETAPAPTKSLTNFVEVGGSYEALSNNFGQWSGGYFRAVITTGKNTWNAEVNGQYQFGDAGTYIDAGDTYIINDDWYAAVTFGSSVGGFFWPRSRVDSFLNRKWLARKQMITTLGFGYDHAKDVHSDRSVFVGTTYYFEKPWIIEDGIRLNVSSPGTIFSPSGFIAITEGRDKQRYLTLNIGSGEEAYQIVGPTSVLTRFPSQTASLTWRQWVRKTWGLDFVADFYHSPFYHRGGGTLGFFKEF
jgi:YaiO family outer membrane protein